MSGKGNCCDDAIAESFFKTLKTELICQNSYRQEAYVSVSEHIDGFYSTNRRHSALGNLTIRELSEQRKYNYKKNRLINILLKLYK